MSSLNKIKSGKGRLCIPCIFNGGRKATIRVHIDEPSIVHLSIESEPGRPYQSIIDGYLHIDNEMLELSKCYQSVDECKKAIDLINICYFSDNLKILSEDKAIVDKAIDIKRSLKQWSLDIYKGFTESDYFYFMLTDKHYTLIDRIKKALEAGIMAQWMQSKPYELINKIETWVLGK